MYKPLALFAALALSTSALAAAALPDDADGTVDLAAAKAAAGAMFDKLDAKALKRRIAKKDWPAIDLDKDKTVSRDEFLIYVEALFKVADKDSGGALDATEMRSPAGRKLQKLMK